MFYPEAQLSNWLQFEEVFAKAKIRLYNPTLPKRYIILQCFDGIAVWTHTEPVFIRYDKPYLLLGNAMAEMPNFHEMEKFKIMHNKGEPNEYRSIDQEAVDNARDEWWRELLANVLVDLKTKYPDMKEGQFTSLVPIAQEEE